MSSAVFRQIGPYAVERPIGQGGMASVFLARDTRVQDDADPNRPNGLVALKVVHLGSDQEAREILESEQRGAELQQRFCQVSRFVPKVFDSGFTEDYFYIAMEYIAGEDLSQAIHRGGLTWQRAVVITMQLCEFLEQADRFEASASSRRVLLHNDLKPRNIRLTEGDAIKVLDFGAAKALSLSRKVTRNDFGSTAYLSPECLESGDRDVHTDAWALGVLLYEMVRGRQPYRADDTRRLEHLIRSRQPPEAITGYCPPALEAVIAKLLAPYPGDRYGSPAEIQADLASAHAGEDTRALAEGWPREFHEEPATRATRDEGATRATKDELSAHPIHDERAKHAMHDERAKHAMPDEAPTRRTEPPAPPSPTPGSPAAVPPRRRVFRFVRYAAIFIVIALVLNESCVGSRASALANQIPLQDFAGLTTLWPRYESLAESSALGWGVSRLKRALADQTMVLAERVMANYRTPQPTVRENQWKAAQEALTRAVSLAPGDKVLRAALSYCDGHLHRINGEAAKARGQSERAQQEFTAALVSFREAAALKSNWPDPFLGLARTFIYGLEDVDRGADALSQAEKYGHAPGERETTQLADGYRARGEALSRTAATLKDMPQERDYLERASEAFREALARYSTVAAFGNAAINIRDTQKKLNKIEQRITEISRFEGWQPWA
jgi:serine/threonine protein kinase